MEQIEKGAFKNNKKAETVKIGNNVKAIKKKAFYNCTKLKSVVIGKKVTKFGDKVFMNDKKLKKISLKGTKLRTAGKNIFKNISPKAKIKVPKSRISVYRKLLKMKAGKILQF